jgi:hypothetical protein
MKKILSIVIAALLLFTVIPFAAFAANGPTVSVSNAAVCPGQIFQVDVTLSGNTGFSALRVDLAIPQGFTVLNVLCGANFANLQFTPNPAAGIATFATSTTSAADGVVCSFIIQADAFVAAGNYSFGFDACDFYGADLQAASVATVAGTVAAAHTIGTETCKDQICAVCGVTVLGTGHIYGDYVYNNNATCTQDGTETRYCTTCGIAGDTRIAVGSHNFIGAHVLLNYSHSCISCGAVITVCADNDKNHICDTCSAVMSVCADENNDDYCDVCGKDLSEEHKHDLEYTAAVAATCFEQGNLEYWYCAGCDCYFTDAEGKYNIARLSLITPVAHKVEHVAAKAATCFEEGNIEYWYCTECGYAWLDELCTKNTNLKAVILPVAHKVEHVAAKAPTATEEGNIEYWYCTECGYAWLDELCIFNTNLKAVILPATGEVINPPTGDASILYIAAVAVIATLGVAVISFKKREEN